MFKELMPLVRQRLVLITVSPIDDNQLRVNIMPKQIGEGENKALTTPLSVTGSAEDLDKDLPAAIAEFVASHLTLKQSLDSVKAEMDAAAQAARDEAAKKKSKTATTTTPAKKHESATSIEAAKPEPPKPPAPPSLFDAPPTPEPAAATSPADPTPAIATRVASTDAAPAAASV
jgi:PRTRC genetic system protein E